MRSVVRVLLVAGLAAACGDSGNPPPADSSAVDSAAQPAPPEEPAAPFGWMPASADSSRPAGTIGNSEDAFQVVAYLKEWEIQVSPDTIPAGEVTIAIENRGERPHAVEVRNDRAGRWRSAPIPPGGTVTMTMPMPPANFEIASTTEAYVERGMKTVLIVR